MGKKTASGDVTDSVVIIPQGVTPTNRSGTLANGSAQTLMAANASRQGFWVQNLHATDALWISDVGTAVAGQPSLKIAAGALYESPPHAVPTGAISVIGTSGAEFSAREW